MNVKIAEIFESLQGEGIYLGERQVFIRFFGCNLGCSYCDTPLVDFREYGVTDLAQEISRFSGYHSISLTGGEPLCQVEFLEAFLKNAASSRIKFYLETNGTLPSELRRVIDYVSIIAMDFKLPSSGGGDGYWAKHEEFLKIASQRDVFIKMVVTSNTDVRDITTAAEIIRKVSAAIPVVLQPDGTQWTSLIEKMMLFQRELRMRGIHGVKLLPQAHKLVGIK